MVDVDVLFKLVKGSPEGNVVYSPYSLKRALSMLKPGMVPSEVNGGCNAVKISAANAYGVNEERKVEHENHWFR